MNTGHSRNIPIQKRNTVHQGSGTKISQSTMKIRLNIMQVTRPPTNMMEFLNNGSSASFAIFFMHK